MLKQDFISTVVGSPHRLVNLPFLKSIKKNKIRRHYLYHNRILSRLSFPLSNHLISAGRLRYLVL